MLPHRYLVRQGEVDVIETGRPIRQTMFVFNDIILLTSGGNPNEQAVKSNFNRRKLVAKAMEEIDDDENGERLQHLFLLQTLKEVKIVRALSAADKREWLEALADTSKAGSSTVPEAPEVTPAPQQLAAQPGVVAAGCLPPGWVEKYDEQYSRPYYYCASTSVSTWERPTVDEPLGSGIRAEAARTSARAEVPVGDALEKYLDGLGGTGAAPSAPTSDDAGDGSVLEAKGVVGAAADLQLRPISACSEPQVARSADIPKAGPPIIPDSLFSATSDTGNPDSLASDPVSLQPPPTLPSQPMEMPALPGMPVLASLQTLAASPSVATNGTSAVAVAGEPEARDAFSGMAAINKAELERAIMQRVRARDTAPGDPPEPCATKPTDEPERPPSAAAPQPSRDEQKGGRVCPQCSLEAPAKGRFCPECGYPLQKCEGEGMKPLPSGWVLVTDDQSGHVYYWHENSGRTIWHRPVEDASGAVYYRDPATDELMRL